MQKYNISEIKLNLFAIFLICVLGIAAYSNTFNSPFHFDDRLNIVSNSSFRSLDNLGAIWNFRPTRFITFLTFALNYKIGGLNVFGYHVVNLIIHLISALFVFWFVKLIFQTPEINKTKIYSHSYPIAVFASLIFLLHPLQTESVTYISQRSTSLAALFCLLTLCLYIKFRLLINAEDKNWLVYLIFSFISCIFAMFSKENAVTLPIMIIFSEFFFFKLKKIKIGFLYLITLPIIPVILICYNIANYTTLSKINGVQVSTGDYFYTQLRVLITYIRLFFLPINQNFDYDYPISNSLFDFRVIISLLFIFALVFIAFRIVRKYKLSSFGIFWFFITLMPESSLIRIDDLIYEHRLYLPMVGFGIFLASILFYMLPKIKLKTTMFILSAITLIMLGLTYNRNIIWKDEISLWSNAIKNSPRKARAYNERGVVYINKKNYVKAVSDLNIAIQLDPNYVYAYINCGNAYSLQGKISEAIKYFTKATTINPNYAGSYYNLANAYGVKGDIDKAIENYTLAIKISQNFAEAYNNRAHYYLLKNEKKLAQEDIKKAKKYGHKINPTLLNQFDKE